MPEPTLVTPPADLYLSLLKRCLTRELMPATYRPLRPASTRAARAYEPVAKLLGQRGLGLVVRTKIDHQARTDGRDWPTDAETMVGPDGLDAIQLCLMDVLMDDVPGDLLEAGVWRGGATILMRAVLAAYGDTDRQVWVADSFAGVPHAVPGHPVDRDDRLGGKLAVDLDAVQANFQRYELLDAQVRFLKGWFQDTLPTAPLERLALMRIDGSLYDSTRVALESLYPKLSPGGFVLVDGYYMPDGGETGVKVAVEEYRSANRITEDLERVDATSVLWRRLH